MNRSNPTLAAAIPAALLTALLAACGGTDVPPPPADVAGGRAAIAAAAPAGVEPVAPLLADDGSVMPASPQAVPADAGARTRAGRYATPAQADQLEHALAGRIVRVEVSGSDAAAVDEAAGAVGERLAGLRLADDAPVLVDGRDLRSAAALVERLAQAGVTNTWLVTR